MTCANSNSLSIRPAIQESSENLPLGTILLLEKDFLVAEAEAGPKVPEDAHPRSRRLYSFLVSLPSFPRPPTLRFLHSDFLQGLCHS